MSYCYFKKKQEKSYSPARASRCTGNAVKIIVPHVQNAFYYICLSQLSWPFVYKNRKSRLEIQKVQLIPPEIEILGRNSLLPFQPKWPQNSCIICKIPHDPGHLGPFSRRSTPAVDYSKRPPLLRCNARYLKQFSKPTPSCPLNSAIEYVVNVSVRKILNPFQTLSRKRNSGSKEECTVILSLRHFVFNDTVISFY